MEKRMIGPLCVGVHFPSRDKSLWGEMGRTHGLDRRDASWRIAAPKNVSSPGHGGRKPGEAVSPRQAGDAGFPPHPSTFRFSNGTFTVITFRSTAAVPLTTTGSEPSCTSTASPFSAWRLSISTGIR